MTHQIDLSADAPAAEGAIERSFLAILAAIRARYARARREAAARETLRILESLGPERLYDIGLRDGDLRRLRRGVDPLL